MKSMVRQRPLGDLVFEAREAKRLTQKQLADEAGVAESTVQALEGNLFENPRKRTLRKVGAVLGLNLADPDYDPDDEPGPYMDVIEGFDGDIQQALAWVGSWLAGMKEVERRRKSIVELLDFVNRDKPDDDDPIPRSVHSGPPAPH